MRFQKECSIEWLEECEANSFEEAEKIMDEQADKKDNGEGVMKHADAEKK